MNLFKSLGLAASATLLAVAPALAKIDPGTTRLLQTVDEYVTVKVDPTECTTDFYGYWSPSTLELVLCTHGSVDGEDHDTVRHEVWHIVQHCLTPKTSRTLQPVFKDPEAYKQEILSRISKGDLQRVLRMYPPRMHYSEVEAFVVASTLTADEIREAFTKACVEG